MDDAVRRGDVIGGKYRIEGILGEGAMGIVYAAHHLQLDEPIALKVLRHELAANRDAVKRFTREAQAAAKIKNEHVTRVFDIGELESGTPYIVMEALEGEDLARWLHARGALRLEEAITFVLQGCEALAEAHVLGIVHRDLKPSNLFCSRRPDGGLSIKILDFGISKIAQASAIADDARASGAKATVESPVYMSPEQMLSRADVDHRTDIWALGVILFELLTNEVPFEGETLPELCINIATREPRRLRELRSHLPAEVEATILKCLEKHPERRFENLAEFAGSLFPFAGKEARGSIERIVHVSRRARSAAARTSSASLPWVQSAEGSTIRPLGGTVPPERANATGHLPYLGLGGAAVVVLGVIIFWARPAGRGDQSRSEPEPTPKAAAQPAKPTKMESVPIKAENLPKADDGTSSEPPATGHSLSNVPPASDPEAPATQSSPRAAAPAIAPAASAVNGVDDVSENKQRRHPVSEHERSREREAPASKRAEPSHVEPGTDMSRLRSQKQTREIDEIDPYAK